MDWTKEFSKKEISKNASLILEILLENIHNVNVDFFKNKKIKKEDIKNLYRSIVYISINTFLERLVRVVFDIKASKKSIKYLMKKNIKYIIYKNSLEVTYNYYHSRELNYYILKSLNHILNKDKSNYKDKNCKYDLNNINLIKKEFFYKHKKSSFTIILIKKIINKILKITNIYPNKLLFDNTKWLINIFSFQSYFKDIKVKKNTINTELRKKYHNAFKQTFIKNIDNLSFLNLNNYNDLISISELFAEWVEKSLPSSLVEDFEIRYNYYLKYFLKNKFNELHATVGVLFNDNFKIFTSIARFHNRKIFIHDHGVNNFIKYFNSNNSIPNFNKMMPLLCFSDNYLAWGRGLLADQWLGVEQKYNLKIHNIGSVYLNSFKRKIYEIKKKKKLKILYPSSPYKEFMAGLDEITPEENYNHKYIISIFLKKLIKNYDVEIIYKNFLSSFEMYKKDPIFILMHDHILKGQIKITFNSPTTLMYECDILLLDMLSTTFAEASVIGIPTIIFSNKFDYKIACKDGKKINDRFEKNNIIFYDVKKGLKCFELLLKNYNNYKLINQNLISDYQNLIACPIDKHSFINKLNLLRNDSNKS